MRHSVDTHRKEKYQSICFSEVVTLADGYLLTLVIPVEALDVYLVLHRTAWSPIKTFFLFPTRVEWSISDERKGNCSTNCWNCLGVKWSKFNLMELDQLWKIWYCLWRLIINSLCWFNIRYCQSKQSVCHRCPLLKWVDLMCNSFKNTQEWEKKESETLKKYSSERKWSMINSICWLY